MSELPLWRERLSQSENPLHPMRLDAARMTDADDDPHPPAHVSLAGIPVVQQSAVIPYRCVVGAIEVLVVTSRRKGKWIVPKGLVITGMAPQDSAVKEALEEAGVGGTVRFGLLGTVVKERKSETCRTQVFAMEVTEVYEFWKEMEVRQRRWLSWSEAEQLLGAGRMWSCFERLSAHVREMQP